MRNLLDSKFLGSSYYQFRAENKVRVSLCFQVETEICGSQVTVGSHNSLVTIYIALAVIGITFLLVLLFVLAIKSIVISSKLQTNRKNRKINHT